VVVVAMERKVLSDRLSRRVRLISALAVLPTTFVFLILIATANPYATSGIAVTCALLILVIVAPLARGEDSWIARALDVKPLEYVGKVSLSLYLLHFPVLIVLGRLGWMAGDT